MRLTSIPNSNSIRLWVTIAVLAHFIVVVFHGQAHTRLGVALSTWQQVYVLTIIVIAPLVALALLFTRYTEAALWLLLASMLGSMIFGILYHFIIISPDHVAHLPAGAARGSFRVSAQLLTVTEAIGVAVASIAIRKWLKRR
jgi:membrane-associated HD superfamily phosphohydrolase